MVIAAGITYIFIIPKKKNVCCTQCLHVEKIAAKVCNSVCLINDRFGRIQVKQKYIVTIKYNLLVLAKC